MPEGKGKYDDLCSYVREKSESVLAAVIVLGGKHGNGFSCQTFDPEFQFLLPEMLEDVARTIRAENQAIIAKKGH